MSNGFKKLLFVLGTRPEMIKLAPLILKVRALGAEAVLVNSGQHADLLSPLFELFDVYPVHSLSAMVSGQGLNPLLATVVNKLDAVLEKEQPDCVVVQGDTATALAGALAAFNRRIPVAHVEAAFAQGTQAAHFQKK